MSRISVVFPALFGPITPRISPGAITKETLDIVKGRARRPAAPG